MQHTVLLMKFLQFCDFVAFGLVARTVLLFMCAVDEDPSDEAFINSTVRDVYRAAWPSSEILKDESDSFTTLSMLSSRLLGHVEKVLAGRAERAQSS